MATIKDLREWMKDLGGKIEIVDEGTVERRGENYLAFDLYTQRHEFFIHATEHPDHPGGRICFTGYRQAEIVAKQSHECECYDHGGPFSRETWDGFLADVAVIEQPGTAADANRLWDMAVPIKDWDVGRYLQEQDIGPKAFDLDALKSATGVRYFDRDAGKDPSLIWFEDELHGRTLNGGYRLPSGMMVAIRNQVGEITAVRLSELYDDESITMMFGSPQDGAVQLALPEPGQALGLAVNVEDALQAYDKLGVVTWAVLDPDRFATISLPSAISKIQIFPDGDKMDTLIKATVAGQTLRDRGLEVTVHWPCPLKR